MKQKRHSTEEIIRILRQVDNGAHIGLTEKEPTAADPEERFFTPGF